MLDAGLAGHLNEQLRAALRARKHDLFVAHLNSLPSAFLPSMLDSRYILHQIVGYYHSGYGYLDSGPPYLMLDALLAWDLAHPTHPLTLDIHCLDAEFGWTPLYMCFVSSHPMLGKKLLTHPGCDPMRPNTNPRENPLQVTIDMYRGYSHQQSFLVMIGYTEFTLDVLGLRFSLLGHEDVQEYDVFAHLQNGLLSPSAKTGVAEILRDYLVDPAWMRYWARYMLEIHANPKATVTERQAFTAATTVIG